jgi:polysaccharide export outer membrane protein
MMRLLLPSLFLLFGNLLPASTAETRLGEGDIFRLAIDGPPPEYVVDFALQYKVERGGVFVPVIGRVPVAGRTLRELAADIEKRLKDGKVFTDPKVSINPKRKEKKILFREGVPTPGPQAWEEGMTLRQALAGAAGPSWGGDRVRVVRDGKATVFRLKTIKKDPALDPRLFPGDIVEVDGDF